jgi:vacuolar-type H+-ATPase subunit E/Vma4
MTARRGGIQGLEEAVMEEAQERARDILSKAESKAERIRERAERELEVQRATIVERAQARAEALRNDAVAEGHLQAQNYRLKHRETLLDRVFEQARQRLATLPDREDYAARVEVFIREAVTRLGATGEFLVCAGERTNRLLDDALLEALGEDLGVTLRRGEPLLHREGVLVKTPDGHRRYDNTLAARLERLQEALRAPVFHLLMGEAP